MILKILCKLGIHTGEETVGNYKMGWPGLEGKVVVLQIFSCCGRSFIREIKREDVK